MFRLLWLTFFGASRMDPKVEHHVHESPPSMTGILVALAVLSAVGGFVSIPHFLEPMLPLPPLAAGMERFHYFVVGASIAIALAGLAGAAYCFGSGAARAERVRLAFPVLHRVLSGKYYVDEAYEALIGKPLLWISENVFLRFGDQRLFDGTLHGLAALGQRASRVLGRIQSGNLQLYAFLVLAGLAAALWWSLRHA
jgi:NADH-quinone oxidoreductase subunit L